MISTNQSINKNRVGYVCIQIVAFIVAAILLQSCISTKQPAYFKTLQKDETLKGFISNNYESKIIVGDKLGISATSLSAAEDALFNGTSMVTSTAPTSTGPSAGTNVGYMVQADGNVVLRRIGLIAAAGLTRKEFSLKVQKELLAYMKEPLVTVNFLNHKITVLGEVATPQIINLNDERISLIDALVLCGDVTQNADRSKITVVRENGTEKIIKTINLEDNSIFKSDWYYVQPNDIVLVGADKEKYVKEESRRNLQSTLALVASGISLLIIIAGKVIK